MGTDVLDLDQSCWRTLAKYNLLLATLFSVAVLATRAVGVPDPGTVLLVENGALALAFGAIQTYAWLSA